MNKEQQALNTLREKGYTNHFQPIKLEYQYPNEFKILQELVDKATPKKIIKIDKKDIDGVRKESITDIVGYMCECPNCKKIFGWLSISPYCKDCGQALDWSDEVE